MLPTVMILPMPPPCCSRSRSCSCSCCSSIWRGSYGGRDQVFFIDLLPGQTLDIGQTRNGFLISCTPRDGAGAAPATKSSSARMTQTYFAINGQTIKGGLSAPTLSSMATLVGAVVASL